METRHHIYCQLLWNDEVAHLVQIHYLFKAGFVLWVCRSITRGDQQDVCTVPLMVTLMMIFISRDHLQ